MQRTQRSISHCSLKKVLSDHHLIRKGEGVVVGVSGGIDSMVLLDMLSRLKEEMHLKLTVAHVNHGLRGKASDGDERLVRATAKRLKIGFRSARWKPPASGNIQDKARRFRYDLFRSVARNSHASCIVTAHNQDDQAETVLLHLVRGSGVKGLCGMEWATKDTVRIARPLLAFSRAQIEDYAKRRKLRFAHDATNDRTKYARNFLRHEVLPVLATLNPRIKESLADVACVLKDCNRALSDVSRAFAEEFLSHAKGRIVWVREPFIKLPRAIRREVLIHAYEKLCGHRTDLNSDQIRKMESISEGERTTAKYMLPGRARFSRANDILSIHLING